MMEKITLRTVYLFGNIDEDGALDVIHRLLELDQECPGEPIRLFIISDGGIWYHVKQLCDTLLYHMASPVITIGKDYIESGAPAILASGSIRLLFRRAEIRTHLSATDAEGMQIEKRRWTGPVLKEWVDDVGRDDTSSLIYCVRHRSTHLRKSSVSDTALLRRIQRAKDGEYKLSANRALKEGFVDGIIGDVREIAPYEDLLRRPHRRKKKP